ncbi:MAG: transposase [Acidisphaera sp.]|nr:transposase [Acidisphaera sp.]
MDTLKLSPEVFVMPRTRPPYSPEFRRQMVDLVRAGRLPEDLAREFEPTAQSIGAWVAAADKQEGRREEASLGLAAAERDELARLRRENKQLRLERDILSKGRGLVCTRDRRRTLTGQSHDYKRHGTTTLFTALDVASGQVKAAHYRRRRRVEFLDFMNRLVADHPDREIHVVLDNLNTRRPKRDLWLARHPNVRFQFTPTHASLAEPSRDLVLHPQPWRPARRQLHLAPTSQGPHRCLRRQLQQARYPVRLDGRHSSPKTPRYPGQPSMIPGTSRGAEQGVTCGCLDRSPRLYQPEVAAAGSGQRNLIERCFNRLKHWHRASPHVSTSSHVTTLAPSAIAAIRLWTRFESRT